MNKVVTINLNGRAYQLEEGGFDSLRAYLDDAGVRLADDPGKPEIIADLEQAIAEKCDKVLNQYKTVVGADDIKRIIDEMGPVEGVEHAAAQNDSSPKHLYRIKEGSMIWGICTGLAAFFGIDVALVRIIFVGLAVITSGAFCLVYFIMKLIIPEADTMQARAAAHGDPFNAQEVVARVQQEYAHLSAHFGDKHEWHKWKHEMKRERKQWRHNRHDAHVAFRRRPSLLLGLIRGAFAVGLIVALVSLITKSAVFGWAIPAGVPIWLAIILLFILYHAVTGPMRGSGYSHADNTYIYSEWDGLADGIMVLFLAIAFGWAYLHVPQFYFFVHHPILGTDDAIGQITQLFHH